jgi:AAA15 family ATPase/GTPase
MIDTNKESFFISDSLKDVIDYDRLDRNDDDATKITNVINMNGKELDFELVSFEIKNDDDGQRFVLQLIVPAFKINDCLHLSLESGTIRIEGSIFKFGDAGGLHWDAKNKILTCDARLDIEQEVK